MRKVAVTGLGTINSIAKNIEEFRISLKEMKSGIDFITQFDTTDHITKIAAEVKEFNPEDFMDEKLARRYDRFLQFAMVASREAVKDARLDLDGDWRENAAVTVSSGIGGFKTLHQQYLQYFKKGPKAVRPFLIPMMIADMAAGVVALDLGCKGPNFSTMSACASSLHSISLSAMMIKHGYIDVALAGGTEAVIDPMPVAAFANMTALSPNSENPKKACRPFDRDRNGFIMGEGSSVLILESEEHALNRGARIYGYISGFGMTEDAYHISQTDPDGLGAIKSMRQAIDMSGLKPEEIDLVNCHATSTPVGDLSEIKALKSIFKDNLDKLYIQSTKTLMGHTLGAAGASELIASIIECEDGFVHGMPNLENPDDEFIGLRIPTKTENASLKTVLKNAFGFGGHNASILYTKKTGA